MKVEFRRIDKDGVFGITTVTMPMPPVYMDHVKIADQEYVVSKYPLYVLDFDEIDYVVRAIVELEYFQDSRFNQSSEAEAVIEEAQKSLSSVSDVMDNACRAGYYGRGVPVK